MSDKIFYSPIEIELNNFLHQEKIRQQNGWNLIASENQCYPEIYHYLGSCLQNKYAEGTPYNRYYTGCCYVDDIETLAEKNACDLFQAEYANMQPHCGSSANLIAYYASCQKGDTILAMDFNAGGHLSHGYKKNITGDMYQFIHYNVDPLTHLIDYNKIEYMIQKHRPKVIVSGASSYSRLIDYNAIYQLTKKYNAIHIVDMAHIAGLVAARVIPSPIPYADIVTSTTHKTLRGPRGAFILSRKEWQKKIEKAILPGIQGGPLMNVIAAKAWIFAYAQTDEFITYQKNILKNTQMMIHVFLKNNIPIITNGSDNHLFVVNLSQYKIDGKTVSKLLENEGIYVNANAIPYDLLPPSKASGIRIGTPFITAQNKTESDIIHITEKIISIIENNKIE